MCTDSSGGSFDHFKFINILTSCDGNYAVRFLCQCYLRGYRIHAKVYVLISQIWKYNRGEALLKADDWFVTEIIQGVVLAQALMFSLSVARTELSLAWPAMNSRRVICTVADMLI
jgi:hypothetical protein